MARAEVLFVRGEIVAPSHTYGATRQSEVQDRAGFARPCGDPMLVRCTVPTELQPRASARGRYGKRRPGKDDWGFLFAGGTMLLLRGWVIELPKSSSEGVN